MKVKRLLSAFVVLAIMLTTVASMGTVFAADTVVPKITVEIVPDTEGKFAVSEGQYGYYLIATISDYGTLTSSTDDYTGRKLDMWQIDVHFEEGVVAKLGKAFNATSDITKPLVGVLEEDYEWSMILTTTMDTAYPIVGTGETSTEPIMAVKVPFATTTDYFNVTVDGDINIAQYNEEGIRIGSSVEVYSTYANGALPMEVTTPITVGEAPVVEKQVEAMENFENIAETVKSVYSEANGYKISTGYTTGEDGTKTHTYGTVTFNSGGITNPQCIGKAESTETNFVALDAGTEAYRDLQGDSGFEDAVIYGGANDYDGTNWKMSGGIQLRDENNSKVVFINGSVQQGCGSKYGAYTSMVSSGIVEYGFSFKTYDWRELDEETAAEKNATMIGGFGEVVDSTLWGRRTSSYRANNKLIRARLDKTAGYALYNEETAEWVTILPYDAENEDLNWHDVKYMVNLDNKTYTAYLDGVEKVTLPISNADAITGADGIDFNTMNYFYNESLYPTSAYFIDNVYAWENPVTVTFTDKSGAVLDETKTHKGDTVALPEMPGVTLTTTADLTNITEDTTIVCDVQADAVVYTEDFEGATVSEDGTTVVSASANPFNAIKVPAATVSGYTGGTNADAVETTFNTILGTETQTFIVGGGGNDGKDTKRTYSATSNALLVKDGYYDKGIYSFDIDPVTTGTVKVSYDVFVIENRRGHTQTGNGGLMGLYDSANKKIAVTVSEANYASSAAGSYCWMTNDGGTEVKLTGNTNGVWKTMQYYADLDNQLFTIVFDGVTYGPYAFMQEVTQIDQIICGTAQHRGIHAIDNVRVETKAVADTVELIGADGEVIGYAPKTSASDKVAPVAPEVSGKKFIGWYEDAEFAVPMTSYATFAGDKVYALYEDLRKVYTEDFENVTVGEDGTTLTTTSEKPFKSMTVRSAAIDVYSASASAKDLTIDTVLAPGSYTMYVGGGGNADSDTKASFTTSTTALFVDEDGIAKGEYSFSFDPVTTGTVKVSYDLMSVEYRRGHTLTNSGGIMGLYDSAANKIAATVSDTSYNGDNATYGNPGTTFFARDGGTHVGLTSASRGVFKKMEYYADLDNQLYTIVYDGVTYGPFAFAQEVTQLDKLIFGNSQHRGIHVIDNVTVETDAETPKAELIGADGTVVGTAPLSSISDKTAPTAPEVSGKKFMGWYEEDMVTPVTFATYTGTKVYAKYADLILTADFEEAEINYETGKITGTGFDITLGKGTNIPDETIAYIEEGAGADGSKALFVDFDKEGKGNVVYSFPEVTEGKIKVSYDFKITQWAKSQSLTRDNSFGSLISGDASAYTPAFRINENGYTQYSSGWKYVNQLYTYDTTIAEENEVMFGGASGWENMTYYVDLDAKTYTVDYNDTVYGPYPFTGEVDAVNAILFKDNRTDWEGKYYLDNLVVDTAFTGEIPTATVFRTVTFMNGEENLGEIQVKDGEVAEFTGTEPTKAEDELYTYTFNGWATEENGAPVEDMTVTADTIFYAVFEATEKAPVDPDPTYYTVTFVDWDGTELDSQTVEEGAAAVAPSDPTREGYTFTGWDVAFDNITGDLTVTAQYAAIVDPDPTTKYTVKFYQSDDVADMTLWGETQEVEEGAAAVAPETNPTKAEDDTYTYTFKAWDTDFTNVTSNLDIRPIFEATAKPVEPENTFTYVWGDVTGDGEITAADVTAIYTTFAGGTGISSGGYVVGEKLYGSDYVWGDVTGDGEITAADVTAVYTTFAGGTGISSGGYVVGTDKITITY